MEVLDSIYVDLLLSEALDLAERTTEYVNERSQIDGALMDVEANSAYLAESSRHATRLMQIVAWLFTQRAVFEGEITPEDALSKEHKLGSKGVCLAPPVKGWQHMHAEFKSLLSEGEDLYLRICRIDDHFVGKGHKSPVHEILDDLKGSLEAKKAPDSDDAA